MIDKLLLPKQTSTALRRYISQPGVPLMILGNDGSGKKYLAKKLAATVLGKTATSDLESDPYVLVVSKPEAKQDIVIDQIREVIRFLKLKTNGIRDLRRVVLIYDAQQMNEEAQNALLKILEEPSADTLFILTASSAHSVLPTIASRCQKINVFPVPLAEASEFFGDKYSISDIENAWRISGGSVGLMTSILKSEDHELKSAIMQVKEFLGLRSYDRLTWLETNLKSKDQFRLFLDALNLSLAALHHGAIQRSQHGQSNKILKDRKLVKKINKYSTANASQKMLVDELVLNLGI